MTDKNKQLAAWLKEKIAEHKAQGKALMADDRADEAAFEKAAANIYDIFGIVLSVAERNCKGDEAAIGEFFRKRVDQVPSGWHDSLRAAQEHGDEKKIRIEEIKLNAAEEVRKKFCEIWEVEA